MKKLTIIILAVFLSQVVFSGVLYDFTYQFLKSRKVPEQHAVVMAKVLEEETKIIANLDPLLVLAFGLTETGFVNTFGDNGKAVGYFQIHEDALFYVANFYEDVRIFRKSLSSHSELIRYPDWQLKIAYRYLYLTLKNVHKWDITMAISAYNGRKDRYNEYTIKFFRNYSDVINEYYQFSKSYLSRK